MDNDNTAIIFDIKRFAIHDGPGIRTTIFLKGCPLRCAWCHNPESHSLEICEYQNQTYGKNYSLSALMSEIRKDLIFFEESDGGITFSGGEPLIQLPFLINIAELCKKEGFHLALDTCGYIPLKEFKKIVPLIDLFLYDLKLINDKSHKQYTGVSNEIIIQNLKYLNHQKKNIIIRIPIIPTINDTENELNSMLSLIKELKSIKTIHLLPYHKIASHKYDKMGIVQKLNHIQEPSKMQLEQIKDFFQIKGYTTQIGG
jgi:pyruvate formate lyase activating enzyme